MNANDKIVMAELVAEFERLISAVTPTDVTAEHADRGE